MQDIKRTVRAPPMAVRNFPKGNPDYKTNDPIITSPGGVLK